jgi:hypothetical protein
MPADELTPESFRQRPDVVRAVENPRSPRSVLNYMCGCDTAKPEIRDSLNQDETVRPLMTIWFQSGRALDAFCQPFAPVVRELKADPPSLTGEDWTDLKAKLPRCCWPINCRDPVFGAALKPFPTTRLPET